MLDRILNVSESIRYAAIYKDGQLTSKQQSNIANSSATESDKYEELIVNPTILKLASQRGNIDCGGLNYVIVRYGNFFQFISQIENGHISVCIDSSFDPIEIGEKVLKTIEPELSK